MTFAHDVVEFNKTILGIEQRSPELLSAEELNLSVKCLYEELEEFCDAARESNYIGQVDAIVDLMYFANGILYKLGLTADQIEECQSAVHEANMTKRAGINAKRAVGAADAVKPIGWVPPEARLKEIIFGK